MRTRVVLLSALLLVPALAEAAAPRTFKELAGQIVTILSAGVGTLLVLGVVIYLWGIASHMIKLSSGEDAGPWRDFIVWGVAILFVMVSIWGILRLIQATLFQGEVPRTTTALDQTHLLSYDS